MTDDDVMAGPESGGYQRAAQPVSTRQRTAKGGAIWTSKSCAAMKC
jgi:hypothetical protein